MMSHNNRINRSTSIQRKSAFRYLIYACCISAIISGCCKNLSPEYNQNTFTSRDYHVVNPQHLPITRCNVENLHLACDSLVLDTMISKGNFDTFSAVQSALKSINFHQHSLIYGYIYYYGNFSSYHCFVNHKEKQISLPVRSTENCLANTLARQSKFVAFLIPKVSQNYQFTK